MKLLLIGLLVLGVALGLVISDLYYDYRINEIITNEQLKTHNALYNLNYEIMAHEQDVGLLKKENHTLRLSCDAEP